MHTYAQEQGDTRKAVIFSLVITVVITLLFLKIDTSLSITKNIITWIGNIFDTVDTKSADPIIDPIITVITKLIFPSFGYYIFYSVITKWFWKTKMARRWPFLFKTRNINGSWCGFIQRTRDRNGSVESQGDNHRYQERSAFFSIKQHLDRISIRAITEFSEINTDSVTIIEQRFIASYTATSHKDIQCNEVEPYHGTTTLRICGKILEGKYYTDKQSVGTLYLAKVGKDTRKLITRNKLQSIDKDYLKQHIEGCLDKLPTRNRCWYRQKNSIQKATKEQPNFFRKLINLFIKP